jgi:peptidoglycan hydrolase-like protein with peptidoglycan-binding domain
LDDDSRCVAQRPVRGTFWSRLIQWHLREWLVVAGASFAVGAVVVNALFLQTGPHPAPIFANRSSPASVGNAPPMMLPRPRPAGPKAELITPATPAMPTRPRPEIVIELQRALAQRGFYDGPADGIYGPKTDMAVRDFEHTAAVPPTVEPNEALLRTIARSTIKAPAAAPAGDPIADLLAPSKRVIALQRALADYGYGQIRPSGSYDPATRAAIEEFERNRKLPVTGQISDRVTRELAAMTGRPLE